MSFTPPDPPDELIKNISALFRQTTTSDVEYQRDSYPYGSKVYGDNWIFNTSPGASYPRIMSSSAAAGTKIKIKGSMAFEIPPSVPNDMYVRLRVEKITSVEPPVVISDWQLVEEAPLDNPKVYTVETEYFDISEYTAFKIEYEFSYPNINPDGTYFFDWGIKLVGADNGCNDTYFLAQQEIPAYDPAVGYALINGENAIFTSLLSGKQSYFLVDDRPDQKYSTLLWNNASQQIFNSGLTQTGTFESTTGNFAKPTVPFGDTKPGDYIRLEYNKNQVYTIVDVNPNYISASNSYLAMTVVPNIGTISGYNTSITSGHLCMYRMINDGSLITLDVEKEPGSCTSIIAPEFMTDELLNNYEKIILDLTQKEIIN
jgi:hypothetical protein